MPTPLELAKGVIQGANECDDDYGFVVSDEQVEAIAKLVAWAECQKAIEDSNRGDISADRMLAILAGHGMSMHRSLDHLAFTRGLRDAVIGKAGE